MVWSARTSQMVCFGYLVTVVWAIQQFARPVAYVNHPVASAPDRPANAAATAFELPAIDSLAPDVTWRDRFARPSTFEIAAETPPAYASATAGRPALLPTLPTPSSDERLLPALLAQAPAQETAPDAPALPIEIVMNSYAHEQTFADNADAHAAAPSDEFNGEKRERGEALLPVQPPAADRPDLASASRDSSAAGGTQALQRPNGDRAVAASPARGTYRVQRGDTLQTIAKRALGRADPATIKRIIAANPRLRRNPDRLQVGQELVLPTRPQSTDAVGSVVRAVPKAG